MLRALVGLCIALIMRRMPALECGSGASAGSGAAVGGSGDAVAAGAPAALCEEAPRMSSHAGCSSSKTEYAPAPQASARAILDQS